MVNLINFERLIVGMPFCNYCAHVWLSISWAGMSTWAWAILFLCMIALTSTLSRAMSIFAGLVWSPAMWCCLSNVYSCALTFTTSCDIFIILWHFLLLPVFFYISFSSSMPKMLRNIEYQIIQDWALDFRVWFWMNAQEDLPRQLHKQYSKPACAISARHMNYFGACVFIIHKN